MEVKLIKDDAADRIYEISFIPAELSMFNNWFSHLPETKVGLKINGQLYRFSTEQEKACFTYGMSHMFGMVKTKSSIVGLVKKLKTELEGANEKTWDLIRELKTTSLYQLLN